MSPASRGKDRGPYLFPSHGLSSVWMLEREESRVPGTALLLTGHVTLDVSLSPPGPGLLHQPNSKAALGHFFQLFERNL